jgi:hypothetical protein
VRKPLKYMMRWIALPAGLLIIIVGAITFPLPVPTGLTLMVVGMTVAAFNPLVLRWLKRTRKRFPKANARIRRVAPHLPEFVRRVLRRTDTPAM